MNENRVPPNSQPAERQILAACMVDRKNYDVASASLRPDHFYRRSHQQIFEAMGFFGTTDVVTLSEKLTGYDGIADEICEIVSDYSAGSLSDHIGIVTEMAERRDIIMAAYAAQEAAYGDLEKKPVEIANQAHESLYGAIRGQNDSAPKSFADLAPEAIQIFESMSKGETVGLSTGLTELDTELCGLQPGELIIIAGRPSMGKSSLADGIVRNAALRAGKGVMIFSVEMSRQLWLARAWCSEAGISYHQLRRGTLPRRDFQKISLASNIASSHIWIDDTPAINPQQIITKTNLVASKCNIGLIVVDYLQLMASTERTKEENRQREVTKISAALKLAAKTFNCPVVALSQLSRACEHRPVKIPMLSDLRESGAIEQDADVVLFLYRDEVYNEDESKEKGQCRIVIGKQRNGPTGHVMVAFDKDKMTFKNLETRRGDDGSGDDYRTWND